MQTDYRLVCEARDKGCPKAYADLMAAYREPLYLLLLRMSHNTTTAADLTIETFAKAFLQLSRYSPSGSFSSWLYTIGVNTYIDHIRRRRLDTIPLSNTEIKTDGGIIEYQIPSNQPDPEQALIRLERDENLRLIVDQLKEPYRQIILLRYYEDLSYEEIARKLHIPLGTVKIRLSRAKNLLSSIAKKEGDLM